MIVVHAASQLLEVVESRKRKGEALKCKTDIKIGEPLLGSILGF